MNTDYTFTNEKFSITEDIFFTVDTTVIKGNKICKLKTLKIYYHGETFEMLVGSPIYKNLISDGFKSIMSIELVNYLSRLFNHENLFDVYSSQINSYENNDNIAILGAENRDIQQEIENLIIHDKSISSLY